MTFDDDFGRFHFMVGTMNIRLVSVGLGWPPPERITFDSDTMAMREATPDDDPFQVMRLIRCSQLTDEQVGDMDHVCRGAEYEYEIRSESEGRV